LATGALLAACSALPILANPAAAAASLTLVAYSTPKPAYGKLISAFQATSAGQGVTFSQSYGPSNTQANSVAAGLSADVVNFSTTLDMKELVKAGEVSSSWASGPTQGMVADSVVAFVVRKGNPLNITTWADLIKPGVQVITPNPLSSGSAQWNILAAYGAQLALGRTPTEAKAYVTQLLQRTVAQPASASAALQTFLSGQGNVLLEYESDASYAVSQGQPLQYSIPDQTILIQTPIAVVKTSSNQSAAKAFVSYLLSTAGQTVWAQNGYRPVLKSVAKDFASTFPTPKNLFTVASLGGWDKIEQSFFNPTTGWVAKAESGLGTSTR
jgi:sulfate transport system substrate-binding protein